MDKLKSILKSIWANDAVRRVVHTFWQTFLATLAVSAAGAHDLGTAKGAVLAAVAAALAAVKAVLVARS